MNCVQDYVTKSLPQLSYIYMYDAHTRRKLSFLLCLKNEKCSAFFQKKNEKCYKKVGAFSQKMLEHFDAKKNIYEGRCGAPQ